MDINVIYGGFMLAILIGNLMVDGIKKMNGEVFFPDSTFFTFVLGASSILFQIRLMKFDFDDRISWGFVVIFLLISLPFFFLSIRKRTISIYDIDDSKLEKIVVDVFQQYKLPLKKKKDSWEFILVLGEKERSVKLERGALQSSKCSLIIEGYRGIPNLDLVLEDIQRAVTKESIPKIGYRGLLDFAIAIGICIASLWFYRFIYLP
ncbi:hypothetical protein SAMN02745975_01091 [Geosporobacter subterraneus DSM 17957]|uniref:Uncharacterized protein n=1 Tax=Geosporobacter subterraneus DSM 17957 TaxID=1121919 RepID=A0A1M6FU28_9FIRM|nr:hypothetical protein [Geosporobacter subterraneus]SHJ01216.1 hypothetical protein SAMN02745975_01091 [Geosporobacter subterraneus DSM 17957]